VSCKEAPRSIEKTKNKAILESLNNINALRPIKYTPKEKHEYPGELFQGGVNTMEEDTERQADPTVRKEGFIAQEVAVEFPEAVTDSGIDLKDHDTDEVLVTNVKHLDAHMINVYLVSAVKELKDELDAAKARITQLES